MGGSYDFLNSDPGFQNLVTQVNADTEGGDVLNMYDVIDNIPNQRGIGELDDGAKYYAAIILKNTMTDANPQLKKEILDAVTNQGKAASRKAETEGQKVVRRILTKSKKLNEMNPLVDKKEGSTDVASPKETYLSATDPTGAGSLQGTQTQ